MNIGYPITEKSEIAPPLDVRLKLAKGRGVRRIFHLIYLFVWVLGSCSLPEAPVDDGIETPTPSATASAIASEITPTLVHQTPTATLTLSTPTLTQAVEVNPTPTQANTIPPDGVEIVEAPRFGVQPGTPLGMMNIARLEEGCNWMGIGGQALNQSGLPENNLVAEVGGFLDEVQILELALTGSETVFGPGGYLIKLADRPISSDGSIWIQLFNLSGVPQTKKYFLTTYPDCERNLILINFSELNALSGIKTYLPAISIGR